MSLRFRIWILISCNFFCNSGIISSQTCSLPKPASLYVIQTSSCTATAQWSAVANAFGYKLQYRVSGTTTWTRISVGANILSRNINNLSGGLTYNFKVNAICSNNHLGKTQSKNLVMQNYCSMTPVIDSAKTISPGLVRLYLNHSPYLIYEIDYTDSLTNTSQSILMSNALAYFDVKNLIADHTYFFQVRSSCCINLYSAYSNTVSSHTYKLPNIVLFIMDDATDKSFNFDGGPSFFQTPAVDFLASEGMHLKNYFTVYSLCAPSRSTLITGLYPHQTGVTSNTNRNLPFAIPTIASVLGGTGYFNGWVGKVHLGNLVRPGFNIWYSGPVEGGTESYINPHFSDRFGNRLQINGHLTDVTHSTWN